MTAWAEIWASTLRKKVTRDALAGLESLKVSARLQQGMALVLSSDSLHQEEGKASCPAWTQLRGEFLPPSSAYSTSACLHISSLFWWADDWQLPFTAVVSSNRQQNCLQLRKDMLLKLGSVRQSMSVCLSTKDEADCE